MIKELEIKIDKVFYRDMETSFTIGSYTVVDKDVRAGEREGVFKGLFPRIHEEDVLEVNGSFRMDYKGRRALEIESYRVVIPSTKKALISYLARTVKGVGKKTAEKIVNTFEEDTLDVIIHNWERLAEIPGISSNRAKKIHDNLLINKKFEELALFLIPLGITFLEIIDIYEELGEDALAVILHNPYQLHERDLLTFRKADSIGEYLGMQKNHPMRLMGAILHYMEAGVEAKGHTFVYKKNMIEEINLFLKELREEPIKKEDIEKYLNIMEKEKVISAIGSKEGKKFSITKRLNQENFSAKALISMKGKGLLTKDQVKERVEALRLTGEQISKGQEEAIATALTNNISIVSGGPGTGKTHTVNTLIKTALYTEDPTKEPTIALTAPTGKASERLREMTGLKSQTIHSFLNLAPGRKDDFSKVEKEEEAVDLIIIDESSMIDTILLSEIVKKAKKDKSSILFVGDYEQLPSVGPGLVLRDLMKSKVIPIKVLTEVFRQGKGSNIVSNARAILDKKPEKLVFDNNPEGEFFFIKTKSDQAIKKIIIESIERMIRRYNYKIEDIQVLTTMNNGALGVNSLSYILQGYFNHHEVLATSGRRVFKLNDKVMHTKNNKELGVMNGDTGIVTGLQGKRGKKLLEVDYRGVKVYYSKTNLQELTLAYAITVHKSQGSEFPVIIMPFHDSLGYMMSRSIINTAWTRASEKVICIGDYDALIDGMNKNKDLERNTLLKDRLVHYNSL